MSLKVFQNYLKEELNKSLNTVSAYMGDLEEFEKFIKLKANITLEETKSEDLIAYMLNLKEMGRSQATVNRKLASIRAYYKFLLERGMIEENPSVNIKTPKLEKKEIAYLELEEVESILEKTGEDIKGIRDRAIMELLYATGIRVTEAVFANVEDINLRIGFFTCPGTNGKARIVPMGRYARKALEDYMAIRDKFLTEDIFERALFVNFSGGRLSRQGIWKMLKHYGKMAGIDEERITPHIFRNTFAAHMVMNGADLKSLQELMGHEDLTATQIYLSVSKNRIKDVYDKTHPRA